MVIRRVPQLLVFSLIQPLIFVLMFRYVFGGAIRVPGVRYVDYLMPGVFVHVEVLRDALMRLIMAASVVDFPAPEGPVMITRPSRKPVRPNMTSGMPSSSIVGMTFSMPVTTQ